jgi:hypothetical protein
MTETEKADSLGMLREILLRDDRMTVADLQSLLNDKNRLSEKVAPIIEEHIEFLRKNFPREFATIVDKMIEQKLKLSQQQLLDVIYPSVGQMVAKYVQHQIHRLREDISERIRFLTSRRGLWLRIKARLFGLSDADLVLATLEIAIVEEAFVIQRNSGLLLGSATLAPTINRDVVAGMLTAIKAFVEDAFEREREELELVSYGSYQLLLQNYPSFYVAFAISGVPSAGEQARWREQLNNFAITTEELRKPMPDEKIISEQLDAWFIQPQRERMKTIKVK